MAMKKRGSVLAVVLMLATLLALMTAIVANNTLHNYRTVNWSGDAGTSRYVAFAGVQHAMLKLREKPDFDGRFTGTVPGQPNLIYDVVVKNQRNFITSTSPLGQSSLSNPYNVRDIPANSAKIESNALEIRPGSSSSNSTKADRALSGVIGVALWQPTGFTSAASGQSLIVLEQNSRTRAYDFTRYLGAPRANGSTNTTDGYVDPAQPNALHAEVQSGGLIALADSSLVEGDITAPSSSLSPSSSLGSSRNRSSNRRTSNQPRRNNSNNTSAPPKTAPGNTTPTSGINGTTTGVAQGTGVVSASNTSSNTTGNSTTSTAPITRSSTSSSDSTLTAAVQQQLELAWPNWQAPTTSSAPDDKNYTGDLKQGVPRNILPAVAPFPASQASLVRSNFPPQMSTSTQRVWTPAGWTTQQVSTSGPEVLDHSLPYKGITIPAGQTLTLEAGTYYFADFLQVDGNLEIDDSKGDVIVYVGKTMVVNGQVNFQGDPATLQVYFTSEDRPNDPTTGQPIAVGYSTLKMNPGSRATMVTEGANLYADLNGSRLLGAISGQAIRLHNGASIDYDINLKQRQMAGGSSWKLHGVYETVKK